MSESNLRILGELKEFVDIVHRTPDLLKEFSLVDNGFIRDRKLSFDKLVLLIAKLCKKSLSVELEKFFEEISSDTTCTASAFTQQRKKLDPMFYRIWSQLLCECYYKYQSNNIKRWRGYRLIAMDGSNISLISTSGLSEYFGGQRNQQGFFTQAKTFYCYDILNGLILKSIIAPYRRAEVSLAYQVIESLNDDMIAIYDRNYSSYKTVALHLWQEKEIKFVIRAKDSLNFVKDFLRCKSKSKVINLWPTPEAIKGLKQAGYIIDKNTTVKVRLIRVELPNSTEVLMTNLMQEEGFCVQEFKKLYARRWSVETSIAFQKNILQLESFSGLTPVTVEQDFYATTFIANLCNIIIKKAQYMVDRTSKNKKYPMKINKNKAYGKFRSNLVSLFASKSPETILNILYVYFIRDPLPVRKNRSFQRIVKNKQSKSKHKTFSNYKPTF